MTSREPAMSEAHFSGINTRLIVEHLRNKMAQPAETRGRYEQTLNARTQHPSGRSVREHLPVDTPFSSGAVGVSRSDVEVGL